MPKTFPGHFRIGKNGFKYLKTQPEFRDALPEYLEITDPMLLAKHGNSGTCYENYMLTEEAQREYAPFSA